MEQDRGVVDEGEFVVAGGQSAPLLEQVKPSFDHGAAAIVPCVECRWAPAAGTAPCAVPGLIGRFGDHRDNAASTQMPPDRPRGVGLIGANTVRASTCPTPPRPRDPQMPHQMREHRCVTSLAGTDQSHQRSAVPVDKVVDRGAPPTAGAADRVIRRLGVQIRVIRPSPLWGG